MRSNVGATTTAITIRPTPGIKSELTSGLKDVNEPVDLAAQILVLKLREKDVRVQE